MAHTVCMYCPTPECPEHAVDVTLRFSIGRWWSDLPVCESCNALLVENPPQAQEDAP